MSDAALRSPVTSESRWVRTLLIVAGAGTLAGIVLLPLLVVFTEGLSKGLGAFLEGLSDPDALAAIRLTLLVAAIAVPFNAVFGIAASWSSAAARCSTSPI